jgi:integrase
VVQFVYVVNRRSGTVCIREDCPNPDGSARRIQHQVKLGTLAELPTKTAARRKLEELMSKKTETPLAKDMTFQELAERWMAAVGPTKKASSLDTYKRALRYVLPTFGRYEIKTINKERIQLFLAETARKYSHSVLKASRTVLSMTLGWAAECGWIERNPCENIPLPKQAGGKRVKRVALNAEQAAAIAGELEEPYATLVLVLYVTGLRIGEALGLKWSDLQDNVLTIERRVYKGQVDEVKTTRSVRQITLGADMVERIHKLHSQFANSEWMFQSDVGTPVNPGNALKRYVRPAAKKLEITFGGWHDFRHSLSTNLRRGGVHPKVVSDILGHSKVHLAMDVYDRTDLRDISQALNFVNQDVAKVLPTGSVNP